MMSRLKIIYVLTLFVLFTSCEQDNIATIVVKADTDRVIRNPLNGWVMYATGNLTTDMFNAYDKMEVPSLDAEVRVSDYANTLYLRTSWTLFNPEENVYGWDVNDGFKWIINYAKERGLKLAFRVVVDSRDKPYDFTPEFVRDAGAEGFESKSGNRTVWSPYCDDEIFQAKYEKFMKAFGERFDNADEVDFIDGYGLGKWGESHAVAYKDPANREKVYEWIIDLYLANFKNVPLAINYHRLIGTPDSWASVDADSERLLDYAVERGYILRHDAFGMTDYYPEWEKNYAKKWLYKRPILMEGGWIVYKKHHNYGKDSRGYQTPFDVRKGEFDDSKEAHVNTMDFRVGETNTWFNSAEIYRLVEEFISEGGYRLVPDLVTLPTQIVKGESIIIAHQWQNLGWGYCPTNIPQWEGKYKVAFALLDDRNNPVKIFVDEQTKLHEWIKGKETAYTFSLMMNNVPVGNYTWAVGIVNTKKSNAIGINLSASLDITTEAGWVTLVSVQIK